MLTKPQDLKIHNEDSELFLSICLPKFFNQVYEMPGRILCNSLRRDLVSGSGTTILNPHIIHLSCAKLIFMLSIQIDFSLVVYTQRGPSISNILSDFKQNWTLN